MRTISVFWNEYLPKLALIPVALAGFIGLSSVVRARLAAILAPWAALPVMQGLAWNGYMDGWLAVYGSVAMLALARWYDDGERWALVLGMCALGIVLCLKSEGRLIAMGALPVLALGALRHRRRLSPRDLLLGLLFVPFLLWVRLTGLLPAVGDFDAHDVLTRGLPLLTNPAEVGFRLRYLADTALEATPFIDIASAVVVLVLLVRPRPGVLLSGVGMIIYLAGIVMVYFGTPLDFRVHVITSLSRVLMFPTMFLLIGLLDLLLPLLATGKDGFSTGAGWAWETTDNSVR